MRKKAVLCLMVLGIPLLLAFVGSSITWWHYYFDDSFITYRYAKNLALGHGITWNPGHAPTEGYTNFLLVVLLAPFIKCGLDPLTVTRVLSFLSAALVSLMIFRWAKLEHHCSTPVAMMLGSLILFAPQTRELCLLGLETVVYSLCLLMTYQFGVEFLHARRTRDAVLLGALVILTMLLRPEAGLLYPVLVVVYLTRLGPEQPRSLVPLAVASASMFSLGAVYVAWKAAHFGAILPNPVFIKLASSSLVSKLGMQSVFAFIDANALLLSLSLASLLVVLLDENSDRRVKTSLVFGLGIVAIYALFFLRTDTLADGSGRFMYPILPILVCLTIPALGAALHALDALTGRSALAFAGLLAVFLLAFGPQDVFRAYSHLKGLAPNNEWKISGLLVQKEYRAARALSGFPAIADVRVAWGDAGVMPYFTGAIWLDTVGLNDTFIARTSSKTELVDYYFQWQPDLAILGSNKDHSWMSYGHGPLGDLASWAQDPRWDEYVYAGTTKVSGPIYDLQYFVRASSRFAGPLRELLRSQVVDGWYDPVPFRTGTRTPHEGTQPTWHARAR